MLMAISMRANGKMTRLMVMAATHMLMVQPTWENGKMINNMVKESKHGLMVPNTRANTSKERNTERVLLPLQTVVSTAETSFRMKSLVKVDTSGQMEKLTKDNGKRTKCTDTES